MGVLVIPLQDFTTVCSPRKDEALERRRVFPTPVGDGQQRVELGAARGDEAGQLLFPR